ncbi:MAG: hypothetical protein RI883_1316 [Bacteroidota bacterium]|jgi:hypothetical protein
MKKILFSAIGLILLGSSQITYSQNESGAIQCESYSLSRPLSELVAEEQASNKKNEKRLQKTRLKDLESKDKKHREPQKFLYSEEKDGAAYGTDPSLIQTINGTRPGPDMRLNINGQNSNSAPHDPSGAAGLTHYIQATNATPCRIYNKTTGAIVSTFTMGTLWNPDLTENDGDPIVMYDRYANRWVLAQFGNSGGSKIYIAVSTSSDPLGTWSCYTFTSPSFPDYLKFSIWQDGYYMTSNQSSQKVFAFERTAMLAGSPTARSVYASFNPPDGGGFFCPLPADADGNGGLPAPGTPCPIMSYSDNAWGGVIDGIQIYQMAVNWVPTTPTATISFVSAVATSAFDATYSGSWNDIAQPGTSLKLDGIGGVLMYRAQYRKGTTHNTVCLSWPVRISSTQRSIMWAELRQNLGTGAWTVYQQQIFAPDIYNRWMGSISMDDAGSIGLCYAKSGSSTVYPSLAYTGRLATDPINTMTITETIAATGTISQGTSWYGGNRFGDYAHTSLDPDGSTFWHTGEYLGGTTAADPKRTRIYSFAITLPTDAIVSITSSDLDNTICIGTSVTFTAVPTNGGTTPVYQWYINGNPVGTNSTTFTTSALTTGQVVTCIMTSNMPGVTSNPATSNGVTTTVTAPVTPTVSIIGNTTICAGTQASFVASAGNTGSTPTYQWTVNSSNVGTSSTSYSYTPSNGDVIGVTLTSSNTCVTISTANATPVNIVVIPAPATPTISQNTNILTSSSTTGNKWYLNGVLIPGATSQNYTATLNGTYTVVVTSGGCASAASTGIVINGIAAITEIDPYIFSIFPNPSQGDFSVSFNANLSETYKLKVFNQAGQLVYEDAIDNQNGQIVKAVQLGKVASGVYNVTLSNGQIESSKKIIIKKD